MRYLLYVLRLPNSCGIGFGMYFCDLLIVLRGGRNFLICWLGECLSDNTAGGYDSCDSCGSWLVDKLLRLSCCWAAAALLPGKPGRMNWPEKGEPPE